jgi:hypothetical protein
VLSDHKRERTVVSNLFGGMYCLIINVNEYLLGIYPFLIRWDAPSDHKHERTVFAKLSGFDPFGCTVGS